MWNLRRRKVSKQHVDSRWIEKWYYKFDLAKEENRTVVNFVSKKRKQSKVQQNCTYFGILNGWSGKQAIEDFNGTNNNYNVNTNVFKKIEQISRDKEKKKKKVYIHSQAASVKRHQRKQTQVHRNAHTRARSSVCVRASARVTLLFFVLLLLFHSLSLSLSFFTSSFAFLTTHASERLRSHDMCAQKLFHSFFIPSTNAVLIFAIFYFGVHNVSRNHSTIFDRCEHISVNSSQCIRLRVVRACIWIALNVTVMYNEFCLFKLNREFFQFSKEIWFKSGKNKIDDKNTHHAEVKCKWQWQLLMENWTTPTYNCFRQKKKTKEKNVGIWNFQIKSHTMCTDTETNNSIYLYTFGCL